MNLLLNRFSNRKNQKQNSHSKINIYVRIMLNVLKIGLLTMFLYLLCRFTILDTAENAADQFDMAGKVNMCDRDYYEKNYASLYDTLKLYELSGDHFDLYWEIVDAYLDYQEYLVWSRLDEADFLLTDPSGKTDRQVVLQELAGKVNLNAENCVFEKNRATLEAWAEEVR